MVDFKWNYIAFLLCCQVFVLYLFLTCDRILEKEWEMLDFIILFVVAIIVIVIWVLSVVIYAFGAVERLLRKWHNTYFQEIRK